MSIGLPIDLGVLVVSALLVLGVVVAGASQRLQTPSALLFLVLGMLVGEEGLGLVAVTDTTLVQDIAVVALLIILFEGGLTTKPTDLRRAALPGGLLASVGVAVTAAITGLAAWALLGIEPLTAALLGAIVASTDAAAVFSTLRTVRLPWRLAAILKVESGANDPLAVVLTLGLLEIWARRPAAEELLLFAFLQPVVGAAVGAGIGYLGSVLLRRLRLPADGLYPVGALAVAGIAYGTAVALRGSGFLAVYVAGLLVGWLVRRRRRGIRDFHEGLANAGEIGLFLVLGLLVLPSRLPGVAAQGLLVVVVLTLVARPLATALCLAPARLPWRQQVVVGWGGLRGAVPIVLATFPITAGHPDGRLLFDIVFFVVLASTLVQGSTVGPLVSWLGVTGTRPAWAPVAEALPIDEVEADMVEVLVAGDLPISGRTLRDVPLPDGMLLAAIVRDERVLVPRGDALLLAGDVLLVVVQDPDRAAERVTAWARAEREPEAHRAVHWPRSRRHGAAPSAAEAGGEGSTDGHAAPEATPSEEGPQG